MQKTYLVTGGAGFIGRHLCGVLLARGYRVRAIDALVPQVHGDSVSSGLDAAPEGLSPEVEFVAADIRDRAALERALDGVDGVFHLAAEVGVGQSMYEIARYVGANDLGTAVLLEALIAKPVPRIVVASSMSVYGEGRYVDRAGTPVPAGIRRPADLAEGRWDPVDVHGAPLLPAPTDEEKPTDLASIYALTKFAQERAVMIAAQAYRIEPVALRLFNVFGPGQALSNPYTGVLANFASRLAAGRPPTIFEDGRQRRDFVHVRDVAEAFALAMEAPRAGGHVINIGSGHSWSIAEVAGLLAGAMGSDLAPEILGRARAGDIRHCFADISKARDLLGFAPSLRLEDSVAELARWVAAQQSVDLGPEMRRQLEARGLVT